jgi:hypothetical protein
MRESSEQTAEEPCVADQTQANLKHDRPETWSWPADRRFEQRRQIRLDIQRRDLSPNCDVLEDGSEDVDLAMPRTGSKTLDDRVLENDPMNRSRMHPTIHEPAVSDNRATHRIRARTERVVVETAVDEFDPFAGASQSPERCRESLPSIRFTNVIEHFDLRRRCPAHETCCPPRRS